MQFALELFLMHLCCVSIYSSSFSKMEESHTFNLVLLSIVLSLCFGFAVYPSTIYFTTGTSKFSKQDSFWPLFSSTSIGWKAFSFRIDFLLLSFLFFLLSFSIYSFIKSELAGKFWASLIIFTFWAAFLGALVWVSFIYLLFLVFWIATNRIFNFPQY